ncbi:hypothetical protein [Lacrimispora sp. JR3]|uniref:hypothetical protein n=1 Tax=Lacrimispora sinapis TaxID=3111456 RepID=UPI0037480A5E
MSEKEEAFEASKIKLNNLKGTLDLSELQFERIKSTIFKSSIWDKEIDKAIADFMNEFDEEEKEEMKQPSQPVLLPESCGINAISV